MSEEQTVNTEVTETEQPTEGETQAGIEAGEKGQSTGKEGLTAKDTQEIDAVADFISKQGLPKEISYFKDKSGKLQFIVPMDGKKYPVDFAGIIKGFNLNQVGYKKLEEGKAIQKQFESFVETLKQNPNELKAFAKRLGLNPAKLAEGWLQEEIDEQSMTDEQKQLKAFKEEKAKFEKEREEHKKTIEEQRIAAESEKYQTKYSEDLISALQKHNISKETASFGSMKGVAKNAVNKVLSALNKGVDMSMEDAVYAAKQEAIAYSQDFLLSVDDDHILDTLPSGLVDRILKASLKRKPGIPTTNTIGKKVELKETGNSNKKGKKVDMDAYFRGL